MIPARRRTGFATILALGIVPAFAADHSNLEENLPLRVEDAYPIAYNAIEAQTYVRFDRQADGSDLVMIGPRLELGAFRNGQLAIAVPYRGGDATKADEGEAQLDALYNFNQEGVWMPAVAIAAGVVQPFDTDADGLESKIALNLTKSIGAWGTRYIPRRLHLNGRWLHNYDPLPQEREDRYFVGLAYSQPIANDWVALMDVYRDELRERGVREEMAELGLRFQLTPQTVLTGAVGSGLNDESRDLRVVIGFQHTLSWPYAGP